MIYFTIEVNKITLFSCKIVKEVLTFKVFSIFRLLIG